MEGCAGLYRGGTARRFRSSLQIVGAAAGPVSSRRLAAFASPASGEVGHGRGDGLRWSNTGWFSAQLEGGATASIRDPKRRNVPEVVSHHLVRRELCWTLRVFLAELPRGGGDRLRHMWLIVDIVRPAASWSSNGTTGVWNGHDGLW